MNETVTKRSRKTPFCFLFVTICVGFDGIFQGVSGTLEEKEAYKEVLL